MMKELNANEDGKRLLLNEWGFKILLFYTAQKSSGDGQNFIVFCKWADGEET